jgi:hypothetical protein
VYRIALFLFSAPLFTVCYHRPNREHKKMLNLHHVFASMVFKAIKTVCRYIVIDVLDALLNPHSQYCFFFLITWIYFNFFNWMLFCRWKPLFIDRRQPYPRWRKGTSSSHCRNVIQCHWMELWYHIYVSFKLWRRRYHRAIHNLSLPCPSPELQNRYQRSVL